MSPTCQETGRRPKMPGQGADWGGAPSGRRRRSSPCLRALLGAAGRRGRAGRGRHRGQWVQYRERLVWPYPLRRMRARLSPGRRRARSACGRERDGRGRAPSGAMRPLPAAIDGARGPGPAGRRGADSAAAAAQRTAPGRVRRCRLSSPAGPGLRPEARTDDAG